MCQAMQELSPLDISVVRKDILKEKVKAERKLLNDAARGLEKEQGKQVSRCVLPTAALPMIGVG